ncbi:hypothetical protein M433DRAFT_66267 [Acidomyces richmondensis BFW]|nr:MAG: hypothetical protein FE78DRAFT_137755 [Acidomyces sp. 'richmondensis']KYG45909.1 hypothetical protein M433DRAFT_66267 [Acidomyces richmondensis BFW]
MLKEHFIASIGIPEKPSGISAAKDESIFIYEFQPLNQQLKAFKKSATPTNCLAVSKNHVYAAQSEKAVVHVYNRHRGTQEATIPFTERITCITLACDYSLLVLGTAGGRIFFWEIASGRQVTTAQSHLQAITALAVDSASSVVLSASADSMVHIWSISAVLSFANIGPQTTAPMQTFTAHRAGLTAIALGHSSSFCNIAITASEDRVCIVWDYHTNTLLRTYLLPEIPTCLDLDPVDRAIYIGYSDGSVQQLDLYDQKMSVHNVTDSTVPIQPPDCSRWKPSDSSIGATLSLALSFDGCTLLSGHKSGSILCWDVPVGRLRGSALQESLPGAVTNLSFLSISGYADEKKPSFNVSTIVKPKFGAFDTGNGTVPGNYTLHVDLPSDMQHCEKEASTFYRALMGPSFPQDLIDQGLSELAVWGTKSPEEQNAALKAQVEALRRLQTASFKKIEEINAERKALLKREQQRLLELSEYERDSKLQ